MWNTYQNTLCYLAHLQNLRWLIIYVTTKNYLIKYVSTCIHQRIHVITGVNYVRLQYLPIHVLLKYFVITFISSSLHDASNNCLPYVCMFYVITHVSNKISMQWFVSSRSIPRENEIGKNLFLIVYWLTLGRIYWFIFID